MELAVLITGGTGTLGKVVTKQLLRRGEVTKIVIFSRDEAAQVKMASEPEYRTNRVAYHIGDITDRDSLVRAIKTYRISHLIHTAALKHVPVCERQPSDCVQVNVVGSRNVLQVAAEFGVKRVVLVSTDKAAQPSNVYGLSKALMERLMHEYNGMGGMAVNTTRFGNLVGSRGSVLDLFLRQAKTEGRVTVTDPTMTRFFIRISQAADTVIYALSSQKSGLTFIPQMRSARLEDFVKAVCEFAHVAPNIETIGPRPGEKQHELVVGVDELPYTQRINDFDGVVLASKVAERATLNAPISSETAKRMDVDELVGMIREVADRSKIEL